MLKINNLSVSIDGKPILSNINFSVKPGTIVAVMGPNGSGKSTLAHTLMGHPSMHISSGQIIMDDFDITKARPDERAKKGLFLSFQHPQEIPGVTLTTLLRRSLNSITQNIIPLKEFLNLIKEKQNLLNIDSSFLKRPINVGFSGGEKKKAEMLQLAVLSPKYAILDETDSGTDVDALRTIGECLQTIRKSSDMGIIVITHYERILRYLNPDVVIVLVEGQIKKIGDSSLARDIENNGFSAYL